MKTCGRCKTEKELTEFGRRGNGHQAWCKLCRKDYDKVYFKKNSLLRTKQIAAVRAKFVDWYISLKDDKPCADCQNKFHFSAMEWDHLPGHRKTSNLADLVHRGNRKAVLEEIKKCELVCANCHAVRTFNRKRLGEVLR